MILEEPSQRLGWGVLRTPLSEMVATKIPRTLKHPTERSAGLIYPGCRVTAPIRRISTTTSIPFVCTGGADIVRGFFHEVPDMPRNYRPRQPKLDWASLRDPEGERRWVERNRAQFAPAGPWRRTDNGTLARALQNGRYTMVVQTPAGWCIVNDLGESFVPADGIRNPCFDSEAAAVLAVDTLPGYFKIR